MKIGGAIVSGLKTFFGVLIPPIKKKFFDQPKIHFIFKFDNSTKSPRGLSSKNSRTEPTNVIEAIYVNDLNWDYQLFFRNNSEYSAYNLKLIQPSIGQTFYLTPKLDPLKAILTNSELSYTAKFYQFYEGKGNVASKLIENPPELLMSGKFILEYTNVSGTKFYTIYDCKEGDENKHKFKSASPKRQFAIFFSFTILLITILSINFLTIFNNGKKDEHATLKEDAHSIVASIFITGYEDAGDYVGFLSQITGFYSRHKEQFPTEYETYKKQLDNWTDYLNKSRDNPYSPNLEGLRGLVTSGKNHLEQLEK